MKKIFINISIILVTLIAISAYKNASNNQEINFPGTVKISENLYFDKNEITNTDWREYMYWTKRVKGENSLEYKNTLPDTTVWDGRDYSFQDIYGLLRNA